MSEINSRHIDNPKVIDMAMPMYNLLKYSNNHSKTAGSLWQYYKDEPFLNNDVALLNFPGNCDTFKF